MRRMKWFLLLTTALASPLLAGEAWAQASPPAETTVQAPGLAPGPTPRRSVPKVSVPRRRLVGHRINPTGNPGRIRRYVDPHVYPGLQKPAPPTAASPIGPLAPVGAALEAAGIKAHLIFLDVGFNNLNTGIQRGFTSNDGFLIAGLDFDMQRIAGLNGGTVHIEEDVIPYVTGNAFATKTGDLTAGFIPFYNPTASKFAELTYEQKLLGDRLDLEFGRSNPSRFFINNICGNLSTCYNNVYIFDANGTVASNGLWSGRFAYNFSPSVYIQAGAYENNAQSVNQDGLVFDGSTDTGILTMAEIGYKTDFTTTRYPQRYEAIGFYTTSNRADPFGSSQPEHGTGGFILQGQKVIWRADGGTQDNLHPTALAAYLDLAGSPNSFAPVTFEVYGGLTLQAPLQSRPFDSIGFKVHLTELSTSEQSYLQYANLAAGGSGYNKGRDSIGFELNAHVQLGPYVAVEPTISYYANANNYFAPSSTVVAHDGFFVGGILSAGLGQALGLSSTP